MNCVKRPVRWLLTSCALSACVMIGNAAFAGIDFYGDYSPTTTWDSYTTGRIGDTSAGTLSITAGDPDDLVSRYVYIGSSGTASGLVSVDGVGSTWNNSRYLYVGDGATGILQVTNGGALTIGRNTSIGCQSSGTGSVAIDASTWNNGDLIVGESGTGTLDILNGSTVTSGNSFIGAGSYFMGYGAGTVTVDNSTWNVGTLGIAHDGYSPTDGSGALNIWNGAQVVATGNVYGNGPIDFAGGTLSARSLTASSLTGTGTIETKGFVGDAVLLFESGLTNNFMVNGSSISVHLDMSDTNNVGDLGVGSVGTGTLTIRNGITVTSTSGKLGIGAGSSGTATVDGATWLTNGLDIGDSGNGTLNISNGGTVRMLSKDQSSVTVGGDSSGAGVVNVSGSGSMLTDIGSFEVGWFGTGEVNITDHAILETGFQTVDPGWPPYVPPSVMPHEGLIGASNNATVTVDNATWNSYSDLLVGVGNESGPYYAAGVLNIYNGAAVNNPNGTVRVHETLLSAGSKIDFGANGGTLTTKGLHAGAADLDGTGTIVTRGLVGDMDFTFDAGTASFTLNGTGQNIAMSVDMSDSDNVTDFGTGFLSNSHVTIQNGTVYSTKGYLGFRSGVSGTVTVDGAGQWITPTAYVGYQGYGTLRITNGGYVETDTAYLAYADGTDGEVAVDGAASVWQNNGDLYDGNETNGRIYITNGAQVNVDGETHVGEVDAAGGRIFFDQNGGTLTTMSLFTKLTNLRGNGSVLTYGLVADANIEFDGVDTANFGVVNSYTPIGGSASTSGTVTVNVDMSDSTHVASLGAGFRGAGALTIKNGAVVHSTDGWLGYNLYGQGTATVTGSSSVWNASGNMYIGREGTGLLQVANGGTMNNVDGYVGYGKIGTASITNGGVWNNSHNLYVGIRQNGTSEMMETVGTLNINGGTVTSPTVYIGANEDSFAPGGNMFTAGTGSVVVGNAGALDVTGDLIIGGAEGGDPMSPYGGGGGNQYGTLTINTGGAVTANNTYVSSYAAGMGHIVFGGGVLNTKNLYAAPSDLTGSGTINAHGAIVDGSHVTFDSISGASKSYTINESVTMNLDLSDSTNVGVFGAGYTGSGSVTIDSTAVYCPKGYIGLKDNSTGVVTVTGSGGCWNVPSLNVGGDSSDPAAGGGNATLNITNGGTVAVNYINTGGGSYMNQKAINFDGGVLVPYDADSGAWIAYNVNVYVKEGGATFDTAGHTMTIRSALQHGGTVTDGGITKTGDGTLVLTSYSSNDYTGTTTVEAGVLELSDANTQNPILNVGGADIKGGKMVFDYMGTAPGVASLLAASYTGGTAPWTTGQFLSSTSDSSHGLGWIDDGMSQLTVMYTLYGDSNLDGSVNGTDLNAVLSYYNQSSQVWENGDFNYDGSVNGTDLNTVLSNYNQSLSSSTAAVPEPSTMLLMVLGLAGWLAWRRK